MSGIDADFRDPPGGAGRSRPRRAAYRNLPGGLRPISDTAVPVRRAARRHPGHPCRDLDETRRNDRLCSAGNDRRGSCLPGASETLRAPRAAAPELHGGARPPTFWRHGDHPGARHSLGNGRRLVAGRRHQDVCRWRRRGICDLSARARGDPQLRAHEDRRPTQQRRCCSAPSRLAAVDPRDRRQGTGSCPGCARGSSHRPAGSGPSSSYRARGQLYGWGGRRSRVGACPRVAGDRGPHGRLHVG